MFSYFLKTIIIVFYDFLLLGSLCRKKQEVHLFICNHIGDVITTLGYLNSFKKQKNIEKLNIYVHPKFLELAKINCKDKIFTLSDFNLKIILLLGRYRFCKKYLANRNIILINPANAFSDGTFDYPTCFPNLNFYDCIKYGCLNLNSDSNFNLALQNNESDKKPKVIICKNAKITKLNHPDLFSLCNDYFQNFNIEILDNSEKTSLVDFFNSINENTIIIGTRSGLLDFAALKKCTILAIYPDKDNFRSFFDLTKLPGSKAQIFQSFESDITEDFLNNLYLQTRINL